MPTNLCQDASDARIAESIRSADFKADGNRWKDSSRSYSCKREPCLFLIADFLRVYKQISASVKS